MILRSRLAAWWRLTRAPFLSVGVLPLILGFALAWRLGYHGPLEPYLLTSVAVVLVMCMSYYLGEWNDRSGDRLNRTFTRFSGGSRVLVEESLPPWVALLLGYLCLVGAAGLVLYLFFEYRPSVWTLLLGGSGIFLGFFYSGRPLRWAYRGLGEIFIGFCYSWLPIATGFFLFAGFFSPGVFLLSVPVGLSIFNVILINEFPDEEADRWIGKRNLVVRFGKERMADLYLGLAILLVFVFVRVLLSEGGRPFWILVLSVVPLSLLLWAIWQVGRQDYRDTKQLERLSRKTLLINVSMTLILIAQQVSHG